jgi:Obg family GTPase CgtA-like protein
MQRIHALMKASWNENENDRVGDNNILIKNRSVVLQKPVEIDLSKIGLDYDHDDYQIISDPAYPNQYKLIGPYIEYIAQMTHWEYPEAVERFGRQLIALGITDQLIQIGATDGDLIMIHTFDFIFTPGMTNPYIPSDLLQQEREHEFMVSKSKQQQQVSSLRNNKNSNSSNNNNNNNNNMMMEDHETSLSWRPFRDGGYLDMDPKELRGYQLQQNHHNEGYSEHDEDDDDWNDILFVNDSDVDDDEEE